MARFDRVAARPMRAIVHIGVGGTAWSASVAAASAQFASRPFAVAGGEGGGGGAGGLTGWLMAQQSWLTHLIAAKVHALHGQPSAAWGLVGLGLAYGVVHAAGPGHGKAVLASYMLANETSLKRGALMALMAALLQAVIAIALVGAAGFVFSATAMEMNHAADWINLASYCSIAVVGAWLVWRKGGALLAALARHADRRRAVAAAPAYAGVAWGRPSVVGAAHVQPLGRGLSRRSARRSGRAGGGDRGLWSCPCPRPRSARRTIFLARRGRNSDRRGRAALLGRDSGAGVRHDAGLVRGWSRGRLRHGDWHGGHDWGARLDRRLRQVDGDASCGGGKLAPWARGEGIRIRRRARGAGVRPRASGRGAKHGLRASCLGVDRSRRASGASSFL